MTFLVDFPLRLGLETLNKRGLCGEDFPVEDLLFGGVTFTESDLPGTLGGDFCFGEPPFFLFDFPLIADLLSPPPLGGLLPSARLGSSFFFEADFGGLLTDLPLPGSFEADFGGLLPGFLIEDLYSPGSLDFGGLLSPFLIEDLELSLPGPFVAVFGGLLTGLLADLVFPGPFEPDSGFFTVSFTDDFDFFSLDFGWLLLGPLGADFGGSLVDDFVLLFSGSLDFGWLLLASLGADFGWLFGPFEADFEIFWLGSLTPDFDLPASLANDFDLPSAFDFALLLSPPLTDLALFLSPPFEKDFTLLLAAPFLVDTEESFRLSFDELASFDLLLGGLSTLLIAFRPELSKPI